MDCFTLLKQDHDEVTELLKKCQAEGAKKAGGETFKTLARNIAVHAKLEETLFYPRFENEREVSGLIERSYEEHHAVEQLLEKMAKMSPGDAEWESGLKELKQNVEQHVKEEERELFPKASKIISKDEAAELGATIAEEKKEMMKGTHREAKEVFARLGL